MAERIVCNKCGTEYQDVPARDYNDGAWYCSCGGALEVEKDDDVVCECCGSIVNRDDAGIGDYGEYFCPECFETYLSELNEEVKATCASLRCAS